MVSLVDTLRNLNVELERDIFQQLGPQNVVME